MASGFPATGLAFGDWHSIRGASNKSAASANVHAIHLSNLIDECLLPSETWLFARAIEPLNKTEKAAQCTERFLQSQRRDVNQEFL
jgi:hypothetical protein